MTDPDLDAAYALETPDDNRKLYANWAATYDAGFAEDMDYRLPELVGAVLAEVYDGNGPVLDVGAGTGLLAERYARIDQTEMDALDISPDMLRVAGEKNLYRQLIAGDLTGTLDIPDNTYAAIASSGTFTHGHVGPDAFDELLRIAQPGAPLVLSINAEHFQARGFADKFAALAPRIRDLEHKMVQIYGANGDDTHQHDKAHIAVFYKR